MDESGKRIILRKDLNKQFFRDLQDHDKQLQVENGHWEDTMAIIDQEIRKYAKRKDENLKVREEETYGSLSYDNESMDRAIVASNKITGNVDKIKKYTAIKEDPYFARIDAFDQDNGYNSYYIGKNANDKLDIYSWKSPIAKPYVTRAQYIEPINGIDYRFILLRLLECQNERVEDFTDYGPFINNLPFKIEEESVEANDDMMVFDAYLKDVLRSHKDKTEIVDIIKTIQAKQYEIISLPASKQFVCQGVAGSGKTMVLLHRLSYILFNNKDIQSANVLVISPSDAYNDFVQGISDVLEIDNLHTSTIDNYFMAVLRKAHLNLRGRIDATIIPGTDYLEYIYSNRFAEELKGYITSVYDGILKALYGQENSSLLADIQVAGKGILDEYEWFKASRLRILSIALGDIEQDSHYSKPFNEMFRCITDVLDFCSLISSNRLGKNYVFFNENFHSFYKAICYLESDANKICLQTRNDLLKARDNELDDLTKDRYVAKGNGTNINEKNEHNLLIAQIDDAISRVHKILAWVPSFSLLAGRLHEVEDLDKIGNFSNIKDAVEFFYNNFVRPVKKEYKVKRKAFQKSDLFVLTLILTELGYELSPKYGYIFIDEAQDISEMEYMVLKAINNNGIFNIYGDLRQNITPFRGISDWSRLKLDVYSLDTNYRNTNEIVNYVADNLHIDMHPIGIDGTRVKIVLARGISQYLSRQSGLKAIICSDSMLHSFEDDEYNILRKTNKLDKTKINVMTVYESKGLEFGSVAVYDEDLTPNEKYIAYTRALDNLVTVII